MSISDIILIIIASVIYVALISTCFVVGRKWFQGKWINLIAGYNTEPKDEQDKYDTEGFSKFMSIVAYVNGFFLIILALIVYLTIKYNLYWLLYFFIFDLIVFDIYSAIHANKFKTKNNK